MDGHRVFRVNEPEIFKSRQARQAFFECIIYRDEESVYADSSLTRRYYRTVKNRVSTLLCV